MKAPLIQFEEENPKTNLRGNRVRPPVRVAGVGGRALRAAASINGSLRRGFFERPTGADAAAAADTSAGGAAAGGAATAGRFSGRETAAVRAAVFAYLDAHGIDGERAAEFVAAKGAAREAAFGDKHRDFLSDVLQTSGAKRSVPQLRRFLKDQLANPCRERAGEPWTPEEDATLQELALLHSNAWKKIEQEMGRVGCRERMRQIKTHCPTVTTNTTGPFTPDEELLFLRGLLLHHHPISDDTTDPSPAALEKISSELIPTRSIISLRKKFENGFRLVWKAAKMKGWKGTEDVDHVGKSKVSKPLNLDVLVELKEISTPGKMSKECDLVLLNSLKNTKAYDETEIFWKSIQKTKGLENWQPKQLSRRWYLLKAKAPALLQTQGHFQECVLHCTRVIENEIKELEKGIVSQELIDDESDEDEDEDDGDEDEEGELEGNTLSTAGSSSTTTPAATATTKTALKNKQMTGKGKGRDAEKETEKAVQKPLPSSTKTPISGSKKKETEKAVQTTLSSSTKTPITGSKKRKESDMPATVIRTQVQTSEKKEKKTKLIK
ncbi:hypothetical protein BDR26DRAFT_921679 [Obelidium mucronatum]|nr:hypothetical protein BDR26DRAFT_921679 [Obelidium mucronatum]